MDSIAKLITEVDGKTLGLDKNIINTNTQQIEIHFIAVKNDKTPVCHLLTFQKLHVGETTLSALINTLVNIHKNKRS